MLRVLTMAWVVWLEMLRRKDVYVLFILLMAFWVSLLSLDVLGLGGLVVYVKEVGLLLAWIFAWILGVGISTRLLPEEERQRTIYPLLAKPIGRAEVVTGKWLGAWTATVAATAVFYAALAGIVWSRGGALHGPMLLQALSVHVAFLGMIAALGIAFSTRLHYDAAATLTALVSVASFLVLPRVPDLAMNVKGAAQTGLLLLHYLLPHFELFDLRTRVVQDYPPLPGAVWLKLMVYAALVTTGFLMLAWLAYRHKRFARGALV